MHWATPGIVAILFYILWLYTHNMTKVFPVLRNKRILLLIAHPDDEAMFFAPTLESLTRPELGNHVKILCMSTGNADGLGDIRRKELEKSALMLGLRSTKDVMVLDDPNFPDSMTTTWHPRLLSNLLTQTFAPKMSSIPASKAPEATIDAIITFDSHGVSGHPNHKSLYDGAQTFIKALMHRHRGWECPVKLYALTSVNIFRKYSGILDAVTTMLAATRYRKAKGEFPTPLIYVSSPNGYRRAQRAMTDAHQSQMVWFRWGYITISRYMSINDLRKHKDP